MTVLAATVLLPLAGVLPELPEAIAMSHALPLSQMLRAGTKRAHKEVEVRLDLPDCIWSLSDYRVCLLRFYRLYRPMEIALQRFGEWQSFGFAASECSLSDRLAADLDALRVALPEIVCAPVSSLPPLGDFANAVGALYVMEGSALGSQFMLPSLQKTLGDGMAGADSFFRGRSAETEAFWKRFRSALDGYGEVHPEQTARVVESAVATFEAIGVWMCP